ncbi:Teichoic acid translocation permease protein TagG [Mariniflexile rhizosphaerae]|uniref:ABC transporter permease n=1 Tax=unclassified Mariniflexile TaxID=2643887 RepID=UPI000CB18073|nr:ABC transporter permease [Mariniflexile sp. TRM1-10]AXP79285.1 Teichoic acid translocation permease protein TagG [Mariniflexile sp. TRM1-10]PLB17776.1 MAG: ABC transporter, permease protein [Flavobacteriaceae bacterium FS1-H7996/R]
MQLETKIYQKENNLKIGKLLSASAKDFFGSHFLAKQLATRDIKSQYRQSYLGIIWAFITPISSAFVWIFLNSTGTVNLSDTGVPYPVFVFSGTLIWSIITESINSPTSNTNAARGIMTKINFPKEALILTGIYKLLFNSSIKIGLLVVLIFAFGIGFHWSLLLFPFAILAAILFGTTIGLFITPISLIYNDIAKIISMGLSLLMYITPVVYAIPKSGIMKTIMELNPFTALILTARDLALGTSPAYLGYFCLVFAISLSLFFIGLLFYRTSIPIIVERLSA